MTERDLIIAYRSLAPELARRLEEAERISSIRKTGLERFRIEIYSLLAEGSRSPSNVEAALEAIEYYRHVMDSPTETKRNELLKAIAEAQS